MNEILFLSNEYITGTGHYAFFQYLESGNLDQDAVQWYKNKFTIWLNKSINRYQTNAWNHTRLNGNYYWGSNNMILGTAIDRAGNFGSEFGERQLQ